MKRFSKAALEVSARVAGIAAGLYLAGLLFGASWWG